MKALIFRAKLLFRDDNGSLQDKCSLFYISPRQQLGRKKMCTQSERQFGMILIFDQDQRSQDQESLKSSENFSSNSPNLF